MNIQLATLNFNKTINTYFSPSIKGWRGKAKGATKVALPFLEKYELIALTMGSIRTYTILNTTINAEGRGEITKDAIHLMIASTAVATTVFSKTTSRVLTLLQGIYLDIEKLQKALSKNAP